MAVPETAITGETFREGSLGQQQRHGRRHHLRTDADPPRRRGGNHRVPRPPPAGHHSSARAVLPRASRAWITGAPPMTITKPSSEGSSCRDPYRPLGEVRINGAVIEHEPVEPTLGAAARVPAHRRRRCGSRVASSLRAEPAAATCCKPVRCWCPAGRSLIDGQDREGFSSGASQFDSDITVGRYPRCALGISAAELLVVCCDGRRSSLDGGLDLGELARLLHLIRRRGGDQPRRGRFGDARAPQAPAQPPLLGPGPARPGVSARGHRADLRAHGA